MSVECVCMWSACCLCVGVFVCVKAFTSADGAPQSDDEIYGHEDDDDSLLPHIQKGPNCRPAQRQQQQRQQAAH